MPTCARMQTSLLLHNNTLRCCCCRCLLGPARYRTSSFQRSNATAATNRPLHKCHRCNSVLSTEARLTKHLKEQPAYCREDQAKCQRTQPIPPEGSSPTSADDGLHMDLAKLRITTLLPDHILKSVRRPVAKSFTDALRNVATDNAPESWAAF